MVFLQLNDRNILKDAGKISNELAQKLAEEEYDKFHKRRLRQEPNEDSDFEKAISLIESKNKILS